MSKSPRGSDPHNQVFFDALNVEHIGEMTFRAINAKEAIKKEPRAPSKH